MSDCSFATGGRARGMLRSPRALGQRHHVRAWHVEPTARWPVLVAALPTAQLDELEEFARQMPEELREVLSSLAASLREGDEVFAFDPQQMLTPNEAAKHLGMSRTHLYKLLDNGVIPSHRVGRDRRLIARDVMRFAARRDGERRELAERFAAQDRDRSEAIEEIADLL